MIRRNAICLYLKAIHASRTLLNNLQCLLVIPTIKTWKTNQADASRFFFVQAYKGHFPGYRDKIPPLAFQDIGVFA